jgi:alkylation response protein AidB-like acyl-CoA dehydrogenase
MAAGSVVTSAAALGDPAFEAGVGRDTLGPMADYTPPVRDIAFTLDTIANIDEIVAYDAFPHVDRDMVPGVLDEAARFFSEVFAPTNEIGDREGSRLVDGEVVTPHAFKDAWSKVTEAGWVSVTGDPDFGGHGFPRTIGIAISEMMTSANLAFSLCPMLTGSAITLLTRHGSDELRDLYLANLISGEWTGTMVLTEPEAGSDVGAVRTKATPNDDGSYSLSGVKIFITWGDHDLADNIVHLVLARTPGAPAGTKGISLFLVPKYLPDADGNPGERNAVETVSLEHKLGIHASPTCVLSFDGATGYLVGEENRGMSYMFTMMNQARLEVGLEGLSVAERAYQLASEWAKDRTQGRAVGSTGPSPIIDHPDVRRMLMTMKAYTEAMRGLVYDAVAAEDRHLSSGDEAISAAGRDRLALLTPITKAWCTDRGVDVASIGIQVHGGMGFVEETGAAQFYRDARITPIYEGTNGIQALDLVMRKLPMNDGAVIGGYLDEIAALDSRLAAAGRDVEDLREELARAVASVRKASDWLNGTDDVSARMSGATPYQEMLGTLAGGYYLARQALAALEAGTDDPWMAGKVTTARFYAVNILPKVHGLLDSVTAGSELLFAIDDDLIGSPA